MTLTTITALLYVDDGPQQLQYKRKFKKFKMTKTPALNHFFSHHTIIVDAEFLVLACASNHLLLHRPHLVYRPTPAALAVNMCNVGAR